MAGVGCQSFYRLLFLTEIDFRPQEVHTDGFIQHDVRMGNTKTFVSPNRTILISVTTGRTENRDQRHVLTTIMTP